MSSTPQASPKAKKCLHHSTNGKQCTEDALEGSGYCAMHGPSGSVERSTGGFGTSEVMYTRVDYDKFK